MSAQRFDAVISGLGKAAIGRPLNRSALDLTLDAALAAISDAGLTPADIDGLASWPGATPEPPGFSPIATVDLREALRLKLNWYCAGFELPGQFAAVANACAAVTAGLARHVLVFRTITEASAQAAMRKNPPKMTEPPKANRQYQWQLPFDAMSATNWVALYGQHHFDKYGTTREQMGQIAVNARRNAQLNPDALFRDPLSLDDYLAGRMISSPLSLFDCDTVTDTSTAVIVSAAETCADLRSKPVHIRAVGCALQGRESWDQVDDFSTFPAMQGAAQMMWDGGGLKPKDVDVAQLYDGFSFLTMAWLEALGFCAEGESGAFIEDGTRIALDGELPLNTDGGQLSGGKRHGFGFLHEACLQLRGEAQDRQLKNAPQVAVAAAGGGPQSTCILLTSGPD